MPRMTHIFEISSVNSAMVSLFPSAANRTFQSHGPGKHAKDRANLPEDLSKSGINAQAYLSDSSVLLANRKDGNYVDFQILTWETIDGSIYSCTFYKGLTNDHPGPGNVKAFVLLKDGSLRMGGQHPLIAQSTEAIFAGEVVFGEQGRVKSWSAASGSYMADASVFKINHAVGLVPFPTSKYFNMKNATDEQYRIGIARLDKYSK